MCGGKGEHERLLALFRPEPPADAAGVWVSSNDELRSLPWEQWRLVTERNRGHGVMENTAAERTPQGWRLWCTSCRKGWLVPDEVLGEVVTTRARGGVSEVQLRPHAANI